MKTVVAGVGIPWMRDLALGERILTLLANEGLPREVDLEDWSYGAIAALHHLFEHTYDRAILIGAVQRNGKPGSLRRTFASDQPDDPEEVHLRTVESVAGAISMEDIVVLARYHGALPRRTVVIEVEPEDDGWGEGLSAAVQSSVDRVLAMVHEELQETRGSRSLRFQDDVLLASYWLSREGFGEEHSVEDLSRIVGEEPACLSEVVSELAAKSWVESRAPGLYQLSPAGTAEAERRFAEEFVQDRRLSAHGECNRPDCECHSQEEFTARCLGSEIPK